ncbi:hypothetical protein [Flavobacterium terrae]|uniref:Chromosome segregation protein SMC n=1 Tax=Flavobacterium terrae TaxID=415425 RepID=A0A1M6BGJ0_9FLAO|nr:hypothetical protein [Flavobacterium terrae]SHI47841.1 hypothetical protein SAMN05444363_0747 [Flavobacterium terrae]
MQKNTQKVNNNLKTVIVLLATTLIGSMYYIYKMSDRSKDMIISLREEKHNIIKDLEKSQQLLTQTMTNNSFLSKKVTAEELKIKKLISELKQRKNINANNIADYKKNVTDIDEKIKLLLDEVDVYKKKIDSTNLALKREKTKNDTLLIAHKKLAKKISSASKLYFYDLKTSFFKTRNSGKQIETKKASRTDLITVTFSIAENDFTKPTTKELYVQIINSKNNIVGTKKEKKFGGKSLAYSASKEIKYDGKTTPVTIEVPTNDLESGSFFLNVFDKSKLILNSSFELE